MVFRKKKNKLCRYGSFGVSRFLGQTNTKLFVIYLIIPWYDEFHTPTKSHRNILNLYIKSPWNQVETSSIPTKSPLENYRFPTKSNLNQAAAGRSAAVGEPWPTCSTGWTSMLKGSRQTSGLEGRSFSGDPLGLCHPKVLHWSFGKKQNSDLFPWNKNIRCSTLDWIGFDFPKSHPRCARCCGAWKPGSKSNFHPNGSADFHHSTIITSHFYHFCCWNPGFVDPPSPPSRVTKSSSQLWAHPPPQRVSSTTKKEHENNRHIMKWRWYHDRRSYHIISANCRWTTETIRNQTSYAVLRLQPCDPSAVPAETEDRALKRVAYLYHSPEVSKWVPPQKNNET